MIEGTPKRRQEQLPNHGLKGVLQDTHPSPSHLQASETQPSITPPVAEMKRHPTLIFLNPDRASKHVSDGTEPAPVPSKEAKRAPRNRKRKDTPDKQTGKQRPSEAAVSPPSQQEDHAKLDSIGTYLKKIGKIKLLTAEEEVALAKKIEAGLYAQHKLEEQGEGNEVEKNDLRIVAREGDEAKDRFITANLLLVVSIAKRYIHTFQHLRFDDLIQEGNAGLIRAVEKFDHTKGIKFSTYAAWWIMEAIKRARKDQDPTIRIPAGTAVKVNNIRTARKTLEEEHREATHSAIAKETGYPEKQVGKLSPYVDQTVSSLDTPRGDDGDTSLGELVTTTTSPQYDPERTVMTNQLRKNLQEILQTLSPKEQSFLKLRFGLDGDQPQTLDKIASEVGVSRESIRQIEGDALRKLHAHPTIRDMYDHFES